MGKSKQTDQAGAEIPIASPPLVRTRAITADDLAGWIKARSQFTITRWGDGEWHSVLGRKTGCNTVGQSFVPALRKQLRRRLRSRPPYTMELKKWEKIFEHWVDTWLVNEQLGSLDWIAPDILHKASMKGQLSPVIRALRNAPGVLVIGPSHLEATQDILGFGSMSEVSSKGAFSELDGLREQAFAAAATLPKGAVVSVSAGMTANILFDDLYHRFGNDLILLNAGSLWDPYAGVLSRGYVQSEKFRLCL